MEFTILLVFSANAIRDALNASLTDDGDVKAMILKDCSGRFTGVIVFHKDLFKLLGEDDSGIGDTVDIGVLS